MNGDNTPGAPEDDKTGRAKTGDSDSDNSGNSSSTGNSGNDVVDGREERSHTVLAPAAEAPTSSKDRRNAKEGGDKGTHEVGPSGDERTDNIG